MLLSYYSLQETDDLILINIDNGSLSTSTFDTVDLPDIPPVAAHCFTQRYFILLPRTVNTML